MNKQGKITAISVSSNKGIPKTNVDSARLIENFGIEGDAHAGDWHRQVSLLALESIEKMKLNGLIHLKPGAFAENITTENIDIPELPVGSILEIGEAKLQITQIGKECHSRCAIYYSAGDCVMPREGIFARVIKSGEIKPGDKVKII